MQSLSYHITEKLRIGKHIKVQNENVLILEAQTIYGDKGNFDFGLFITGLNNLSKENNCTDMLFSLETNSSHDEEEYYSCYKMTDNGLITHNITIATNNTTLHNCEIVLRHIKTAIVSNDAVTMLNSAYDKLKKHRIKYFKYLLDQRLFTSHKYIYVWYSESMEVIRFHISSTPYNELLKNNIFE